jgi:hypothetical protein
MTAIHAGFVNTTGHQDPNAVKVIGNPLFLQRIVVSAGFEFLSCPVRKDSALFHVLLLPLAVANVLVK